MLKEIKMTPLELREQFESLLQLVDKGNGIQVYADMSAKLCKLIDCIPLQHILPSGITHLCRSRYNENDEAIRTEAELYYPPAWKLTKMGRANLPHDQIFYASVGFVGHTEEQFDPHYGSVLECDKNIFTDEIAETTRYYTTGLYTIRQNNYPFIILPFCSNGTINHPQMKEAQGYFLEMLTSLYTQETITGIIIPFQQFISERFSRKLEKDNDYLLSTAITNVILHYYQSAGLSLAGILFSSATSQSRSANVAILPEYADRYLVLQKVILHRCRAVQKERFVEPCSEIIDVPASCNFIFIAKEWE